MATYAERLTVLQGVAPEFIHVVTGDGVSRPWRLIDVAAYARRARARLEAFVAAPPATGPAPIGYCEQCRWAERCNTELRQADDLGLVASMRGDQRDALRAVGIATLARPGDGVAGAAEVVRHRRRRAHPAAAAGGRAAQRADDGPAVAHAARPAARPGAAAPAAAERRRPLPRLRGRSLVRGRRGHRVPRRPGRPVRRVHRAVGARPAGGEADGRRPDRPAGRRRAGRPGDARLPLRGLRGDRAQEADRRLRRPRGGARPAAARGAVRRPLSRRPAVDADQQGVVLDQEGRGVLRPVARGRGGQRARQRADVRAVAGRPRPAEARRHRVLQQGRRRLDPRAARLAGAAARRAGGAARAAAAPVLSAASSRREGHRRAGGGAGAGRPAARRRPRAARRPRGLAPPRGPPGLVGGLPAAGPGRRGARARTAPRWAGCPSRSTCGRRRRAACTSTRSRCRTRSCPPATTRSTSTPRRRPARSSSSTPRPVGWCSRRRLSSRRGRADSGRAGR